MTSDLAADMAKQLADQLGITIDINGDENQLSDPEQIGSDGETYLQTIGQWIQQRTILSLVTAGILWDEKRPELCLANPLTQQPRPRYGLVETQMFLETVHVFTDLVIRLAIKNDDPRTDQRFSECSAGQDPVRWMYQAAYQSSLKELKSCLKGTDLGQFTPVAPDVADQSENRTETGSDGSGLQLSQQQLNAKDLSVPVRRTGALACLVAAADGEATLSQQIKQLASGNVRLVSAVAGASFGQKPELAAATNWLGSEHSGALEKLVLECLDAVALAVHWTFSQVFRSAEISRIASLVFLGPDRFTQLDKLFHGNYIDSLLPHPNTPLAAEPPAVYELLALYGFVEPGLSEFRDFAIKQGEIFRLLQRTKELETANQVSTSKNAFSEANTGRIDSRELSATKEQLHSALEAEKTERDLLSRVMNDYRQLLAAQHNQAAGNSEAASAEKEQGAAGLMFTNPWQ